MLFGSTLTVLAAALAIDLADPGQRAAMPRFEQVSHAVSVEQGEFAQGLSYAVRFHVTKSWEGFLPRWPAVNLPLVPRDDWAAYDRLVLDVFSPELDASTLSGFLADPGKGTRIQDGYHLKSTRLPSGGYRRTVLQLKTLQANKPPKAPRILHFFMTEPSVCDLYVSGFNLLKPGEPLPPVSDSFLATRVEPVLAKAEAVRRARAAERARTFVAACQASGQDGEPCWVGKATAMEQIRPRAAFSAAPVGADGFSLRLARGEYEALQVLVRAKDAPLSGVRVAVSDLTCGGDVLPASAITCAPVGYVRTTQLPPYRAAENVATNLPGGYFRRAVPQDTGWWPDAILTWLDRVDVQMGDLQSFWVRVHCPDAQAAGVYRGTLTLSGEGWRKAWPLSVRVYGFAVPKKSPLPLAITFSPSPDHHFDDGADRATVKALKSDPSSPINCWKAHERAWGDFLADYYVTMDSLYHRGDNVHWEVLQRLREQGRLGLFNLGYWTYPATLDEKGRAAWAARVDGGIGAAYRKAKELGLLGHAYLYGCDEVTSDKFPNIRYALSELRRRFPEVPLFTTAYDDRHGVGSELAQMDWFTPTTRRFAQKSETVAPARAAGKQVWWYIACGQQAPYANLFVENAGYEARQLMGAQTVKYRPDGFLYYQLSIWNARRPIGGTSAFTDWDPRSYRTYHGDGSWLCCGPEGTPCSTVRMENFRDGLEDYAYALEYERVTGKRAEVPASVCRDIDQFTDDPQVYYAWRDALAEAIEQNIKKGR